MKILLIGIIITIIIGFVMAIPCLIIGTKNRNYSDWKIDFIWILIFNIFWIIITFITSLSLILHDFENFFKNLDESKNRVMITFTLIPIIFLLSWSIYGFVIFVDNFDNSNSMHSTILKIIFIESFIFIIILFIWVFFNFAFFPDDSEEQRIITIKIASTIIFGFGMAITCITVSIQDKNCSDFTNFFTWVIVFNIFWILFCFLFPLFLFSDLEEPLPLGVFLNILIYIFLFAWLIYGWVKYTSWGSSDSSCTHFRDILLSESIIYSFGWFFSCISISLVLENIG
ncbi:hypothetical protein M0811_11653 [Anaeramoeba ignava]|uniref:Transmembrane protein n=1 Tax=Anaeramoeba ignava TaxID=1746090 RepID=A0A9Q0LBB4_ANAIG|nr:hypothetical protein M0811_11653 [Anaeramoeba ignava]